MQKSSHRKFKLKDPSKLISALTVILDSAILSFFIKQNFFLVFPFLVLIYIAVYALFENRRMAANYSEDDDFDYDEDVEEDIRYSKSVTRKSSGRQRSRDDYDDDEDDENYEPAPKYRKPPVKSVNKDFDVIKSAKFANIDDRDDDDDNSWRTLYNKNTGDMGQNHPAFDEEYKKYFSTTLPDREEIAKAQRKGKYNDDPKVKYRNHDDDSSMGSSDSMESIDSNDSDSGDYSEENGDDDSEEHLFNSGDLENEAVEIKNKVDDLLEDEEDQYNLRHSVTSKLKLFRKSRNSIIEEYTDDGGITSNEELIDELYKNKHRSFFDDSEYSEELSEYKDNNEVSDDSHSEIDSVSKSLETILEYLDIDATVKDVCVGAAVTRYILKLKTISLVNRIKLFEDDLQKMLKRGSLRVVDIHSNKALVGIEIPNSEPSPVSFDNLTLSEEFRKSNSNTSFILGTDLDNNEVLTDIQKMPHLLIAGSPEEKDMCINVLISSILSKVRVFDIDFIMIDINGKNLNKYNGIPHMFTPVVNFPDGAVSELTSLINLINTRLDLFARQDVTNISEYNINMPQNPLSQIIVFINDLEKFMKNNPKTTEELISTIAQKSRSAGVYLIIGTSNYSEEILTGLIKANIPSKICFKLENEDESLSVLGVSGAQKLLGNGDMLYYPRGCSSPERIQGAYITESTIENLVKAIL